jgi:dCMP deaminase
MTERPGWDVYFMEIAHLVSTRATCPRKSVGAVLVQDRRILATGYNGAPKGLPHCPPDGDKNEWPQGCLMAGHCARSLHAEQNAFLQAAMIGVPCKDATIYVTCQPCNTCAKMIVNAGVKRVIYRGEYPDEFSKEIFRLAAIEVLQLAGTELVAVDLGS